MQELTGLQALAVGGTSILIVVGVVIEIVQQARSVDDAQLRDFIEL